MSGLPPEHADSFEAFISAARSRLERGHAEYGGRSFDAHPSELVREIQEELLDQAMWSFILWRRMERLRIAIGGG